MKMQDILIKEAPAGKVPPQPTLNGKPSTGPKGQAWLKKYGATHNPDGTPKAAGMDPAAMAAQGTAMRQPAPDPAPLATTPPPQANALGVQAQAGGAFGQQAATGDKPNTQQGTASAPEPEPAPAAPAQPDNGLATNPEIVSPEVDKAQASSQASAPAPVAPTPTGVGATYAPNPDTVAPTVGTGSSGGLKDRFGNAVKSSSNDELAWVAKNGGAYANRSLYPGPGKWDPKTGRTIREYHEKDNQLLKRMLVIAGLK